MNMHIAPSAVRLSSSNSETMASIVQRHYDQFDGDENAALEALYKFVSGRKTYTEELIRFALRTMLGNVFRIDRATSARALDAPSNSAGRLAAKRVDFTRAEQRAQLAGQTNKTILLNTVYKSGGKKFRLCDATPEMLAPVISHFIGQGQHMLNTGRYLQAVADSVPSGKTVGTVLSEADLMRLRSAV